jgi:hypothetical protein
MLCLRLGLFDKCTANFDLICRCIVAGKWFEKLKLLFSLIKQCNVCNCIFKAFHISEIFYWYMCTSFWIFLFIDHQIKLVKKKSLYLCVPCFQDFQSSKAINLTFIYTYTPLYDFYVSWWQAAKHRTFSNMGEMGSADLLFPSIIVSYHYINQYC